MMGVIYRMGRPALFALDPEDAHELTLKALAAGIYPRSSAPEDTRLSQTVFGLKFPNPVGIAAGFDKDARVCDAVLGLGAGFAEVGTLTPRAQAGNPAPRVFRLVAQDALVNRLGFNNGGHAPALARLTARAGRDGIVGVNIGANKESTDRAADYVQGIDCFSAVASYFTINISSPNTPGLRDLQAPAALDELLGRVMDAREKAVANGATRRPVIVKISPDIATEDISPIAAKLIAHNVDGIAISNTTVARTGVTTRETGGLSGRPLFERSTIMLARMYLETGRHIPLIGIGGIRSAQSAIAKLEAGATLLQLYTGLVYEGPGLIGTIIDGIANELTRRRMATVAALTGQSAETWAAKPMSP